MGVIKKVFFRGQVLAKPRHRNLFLDMEENIHIHYRDLRIELGRAEFEEFASIFQRQAGELGAIIRERDYEDGKLPNANQDDVRIWTESRLRNDIKYHPRRLSIEECGDGYHVHFRNYKLLLDQEEFRELVSAFASIDPHGGYARTYPEVLELLEENEVDFVLAEGNLPGEVLSLAVAAYHLPKVREIFRYIGFSAEQDGAIQTFRGDALRVLVRASTGLAAADFRRFRALAGSVRLVDFLGSCSASVDGNEINRIKCQVLELHSTVLQGAAVNVETDPELWLYAGEGAGVVFPYSNHARGGRSDADELYRRWSALLARFQLGFVKPRKTPYEPDAQSRLATLVDQAIRQDVAAFAAVQRVYLMGSAIRGELGCYQAPFVHGKLVKLGSDIDILIEIDPAREDQLPRNWRLVNKQSSNFCAVYHLGEIPLDPSRAGLCSTQPGLDVVQHLLDAYVHFPSSGHVEEKDAFLKRFGARLVYDRSRDGAMFASEEMQGIAHSLQSDYGLSSLPAIERMAVSSENRLYKVSMPDATLVLKVFLAAGNYSRARIEEHASYERALIDALLARGTVTAAVLHRPDGGCSRVGASPALLYRWLNGELRKKPEYPITEVAGALARLHTLQIGSPLAIAEDFGFDETCMIWLPTFERYLALEWEDIEIKTALESLAPVAQWHHSGSNRGQLFANSPAVHCHGDVTPKNVMLTAGGACFFDFNNAFHGPRIADLIDGAFEFSLAEQYFHLADFNRFDAFIESYACVSALSPAERGDLARWTELLGLIKFTKELRVLLQRPSNESLRRKRALAVADWVLQRRSVQ